MSIRIISGFQDTRTNKEDFAITPFLFLVWMVGEIIKVKGIGICWGYYCLYIGLAWNLPKSFPSFTVMKYSGKYSSDGVDDII